MRQSSERVFGPYHEADRNRWRVVLHRADGTRSSVFFASEAAATEAATAARNATETRTLSDAVTAYVNSIPEKGRQSARYRLAAILQLPGQDRLLCSLTATMAQRLYSERAKTVSSVFICECGPRFCHKRGTGHAKARREKPLAVATHQAELAVAKRMFTWCVERNWIKQNPFAGVKQVGTPSRGKPKLRVNASRQFLNFLLADPSVEATAVLMAFMLALRASAVVNRLVEDLDDNGWLLWVRDNKTAAGDLEIEIPGVLRERLLRLAEGKQPTDRLFGDVTRAWLHYHTVRLCEAAGVPRVTPHGLRGSGATQAVRLGGSIEQVAEAVGHADGGATLKAHYLGGGAIESARARAMTRLLPEETSPGETVLRVIDGGLACTR